MTGTAFTTGVAGGGFPTGGGGFPAGVAGDGLTRPGATGAGSTGRCCDVCNAFARITFGSAAGRAFAGTAFARTVDEEEEDAGEPPTSTGPLTSLLQEASASMTRGM